MISYDTLDKAFLLACQEIAKYEKLLGLINEMEVSNLEVQGTMDRLVGKVIGYESSEG